MREKVKHNEKEREREGERNSERQREGEREGEECVTGALIQWSIQAKNVLYDGWGKHD